MREALTHGWTTAALAQLTNNPKQDIVSGPFGSNLKSEEYVKAGVPIIRLQNVDRNRFLEKNMRFITPLKARELSAHTFRAGDIVITKLGDPLGKACIVPESVQHGIVVADVVRIRIDESRFSRDYVVFAINSPAVANQINSEMMGSTRPRVNLNNIRDLQISLAPLQEQLRIVAKLEQLLGKVGRCQQRLAKVPVLLKRFRQSVLTAACSGRLTADWRDENGCTEGAATLLDQMKVERRERCSPVNGKRKYRDADAVLEENDLPIVPETWRWTNFDHCSWEITVGHVGPMKDRYVEKGVTFLRCQNVRPLRFDSNGLVCIPPDFHAQLSKSELFGGEILVVRSGANTGDCCVFPTELGEANCSDLVITRPLSGLSAQYGALYVNSPIGQALLSLKETGIAQPHFNIGAMRVKAFPLPPFAEQQEIVRRVEGLFALADRMEARLAKVQVQVGQLTTSLLAKAFRGELVPTEAELARQEGRDYEPASVLLERVQQQRIRDEGGAARPIRSRASTAARKIKRTARSPRRAVMSR